MLHMNRDHGQDNLLIVQQLGQLPDAARAMMSGMDSDGIDFVAQSGGHEIDVRLPWSRQLTERAQVRLEVVRMAEHARALAEG